MHEKFFTGIIFRNEIHSESFREYIIQARKKINKDSKCKKYK